MALGKYSRVDGRKSSSSYCSTVTLVVFVGLCLVGVWMMTTTTTSVQDVDVSKNNNEVENKNKNENENEARQQVNDHSEISEERNSKQFEDNPGNLPDDATAKGGETNNATSLTTMQEENNLKQKPGKEEEEDNKSSEGDGDGSKPAEAENNGEQGNGEPRTDKDSQGKDSADVEEAEKKSQTDSDSGGGSGQIEEDKVEKDQAEKGPGEKKDGEKKDQEKNDNDNNNQKEKNDNDNNNQKKKKEEEEEHEQVPVEVFPSGAQSELLNETTTVQNGSWSTQAAESKDEKEAQKSSSPEQQPGYSWKLCNVTAGPDYIPCLDNLQAIRSLRTTKHYEHRERHCPEEPPTCLVPVPEGYQRSIEWPTSREKVKSNLLQMW